jgi:4-amino-4-deoxy-L-arabinose transferase-like glycosyltransferase
MSGARRYTYPLLLALPFLAGIALLKGLTVEIDTFHGSDAGVYHLPTILQFSRHLDFSGYPAAQTPLYHVLFAGYGKVVGFELWKLRLLNVVLSYAAILAIYGLLLRRLERVQAFALSLLIALSPYVLGPSFTLLTDNLALLFGVLALWCFDVARGMGGRAAAASVPGTAVPRDRDPGARPTTAGRALSVARRPPVAFLLGCLAMSAAVLTRQAFLWVALVAAWALLRGPFSLRQRAIGVLAGALALAPFAALVVDWGGLVPPGSDPASCGLCSDSTGAGHDALTLRTLGFALGIFGLYAAMIFGPILARRLRPARAERNVPLSTPAAAPRLLPRLVLVLVLAPLLAGVALLLISPLAYVAPVPGQPADAGYLWRVAEHAPELAGSALLFWVLVPLGVLALVLLARRARVDSLPTVWFTAFLLAALPVRLVYQKYFDPFALLALALFAKPPDLRRPLDYAGIGVLGAAFVVYALTGAG